MLTMLKWEFVSLETVIIVLHAGIFWILLWMERGKGEKNNLQGGWGILEQFPAKLT